MREEQDANDLEIRLRFGETGFLYLEGVDVVQTFDILVNDGHVGLLCNFVHDDRGI